MVEIHQPAGEDIDNVPSLQQVTDVGNTTTDSITAPAFITSGGTSSQVVLGDGTLGAMSSGTPGGSIYDIQYNDGAGGFAGTGNATVDASGNAFFAGTLTTTYNTLDDGSGAASFLAGTAQLINDTSGGTGGGQAGLAIGNGVSGVLTEVATPAQIVVYGNGVSARTYYFSYTGYADNVFADPTVTDGSSNVSFGKRGDTYFGNQYGSFQIVNDIWVSGAHDHYNVPLIVNPDNNLVLQGATANAINGLVLVGSQTDDGTGALFQVNGVSSLRSGNIQIGIASDFGGSGTGGAALFYNGSGTPAFSIAYDNVNTRAGFYNPIGGSGFLIDDTIDNNIVFGTPTNSFGAVVINPNSAGSITTGAFITSGGTSSQFVKGDGSLDSTVYLPNISGTKTATGVATTTFTVTIGVTMANTTYKVITEGGNALSSAVHYVNNKTTTTFDVVYLAGLTGAVAFDWIVAP